MMGKFASRECLDGKISNFTGPGPPVNITHPIPPNCAAAGNFCKTTCKSNGEISMENTVGVIFDFNGTLFNDSEKQERAWRRFAEEEFSRSIADDEFFNYIHGRNNDFVMEYLSKRPLTEDQINNLVERKESIYRQLCIEDKFHFHLAGGAVRLLNELKSRQIPRTIATASRKSNVDFYIRSFGLEKWFDINKIVYDDGTVLGKPNPDFYIRAAKVIALPVQNCIVIEDALSGIQSAYHAGIGKVVAICPKSEKAVFERMPEVFDVISNFHEFDRLLLRA